MNLLTAEQTAENPALAMVIKNIFAQHGAKMETCRYENMEVACRALGVDNSGDVPLKINGPQFDLGHEVKGDIGGPYKAAPYLVYATVYKNGHESCRVTAFPAWWRNGS